MPNRFTRRFADARPPRSTRRGLSLFAALFAALALGTACENSPCHPYYGNNGPCDRGSDGPTYCEREGDGISCLASTVAVTCQDGQFRREECEQGDVCQPGVGCTASEDDPSDSFNDAWADDGGQWQEADAGSSDAPEHDER